MAAALEKHRCPHCKKVFEAKLMSPDTARAGYKCPHCNLFVPLSRANDPQPEAA